MWSFSNHRLQLKSHADISIRALALIHQHSLSNFSAKKTSPWYNPSRFGPRCISQFQYLRSHSQPPTYLLQCPLEPSLILSSDYYWLNSGLSVEFASYYLWLLPISIIYGRPFLVVGRHIAMRGRTVVFNMNECLSMSPGRIPSSIRSQQFLLIFYIFVLGIVYCQYWDTRTIIPIVVCARGSLSFRDSTTVGWIDYKLHTVL